MTDSPISPASSDTPQNGSANGWMSTVLTALLGAFITLLALTPVAYVIYNNMPPHVATVDLQKLVEEGQKSMLVAFGKSGNITEEQRAEAEKTTIEFAKKLSASIDALGQECQCVIVNKAALLGGVSIDYTDDVRKRMQQ